MYTDEDVVLIAASVSAFLKFEYLHFDCFDGEANSARRLQLCALTMREQIVPRRLFAGFMIWILQRRASATYVHVPVMAGSFSNLLTGASTNLVSK